MRVVAWDTETALIRPALLAPPLVCLTWQTPGEKPQIAHRTEAEPILAGWLADPNVLLVGQNVAFDMAVVAEALPTLRPAIFAAFEADRVTDTMIRAWLLDTAAGHYQRKIGQRRREYSLEALAKRYAGIQLQKDAWRTSYENFLDVPLTGWIDRAKQVQAEARARLAALEAEQVTKKEAKQREKTLIGLREMIASDPSQCLRYPIDDACAALAVFQTQEQHAEFLADQFRQARGYFALYLSSAWGLRTDEPGVAILQRETQARLEFVEGELREAGLVKSDGVRDTKAAKARMIRICLERSIPIPRTEAHETCELGDACEDHVCLDAEACEDSEDHLLELYAELSTLKKVLSNDVEALLKGIYYPVHTRYGFAATGRTTSSNPNIQNVRRMPGIREAFVPRPGKIFVECDYPQLELFTLAQCCMSWLGWSKLAEALNAGLDPHLWVASVILGISYDEAKANKKRPDVARSRQLAKVANFGFPGGLGADSFIAFAKGSMSKKQFMELGLTPESVRLLKKQWFEAWPEMPHYFGRINKLCDNDSNRASVETLFTKRFRGNATYCAACNNGFQALGSDCAKNAAWLIAKEQYVETRPSPDHDVSPLFNTRTVAFVHDEFILEANDDGRAHDVGYRLAAVMAEGANIYLPDVPIPLAKLEPVLMRRWSKDAVSVFDNNGRLVPWAA